MTKSCELTPFLKWAGGKRWFVQNFAHLLPDSFSRYFEPFLGGGAVYFHLRPKFATLSDINSEVIDAYRGIKENWRFIDRSLKYHQLKHSHDHYYNTRQSQPSSLLQKASRTIYLNRTCFNGIYRVNHTGKFNVPMGTKTKVLLDSDNFEAMSRLLQTATLSVSSFEKTIALAKENDFVFVDPPYTVRHNLNGFIKYNEKLFSWDDQMALADCLVAAKNRGTKILITNANHQSIRDLYAGRGFSMQVVSRYSPIAASGTDRRQYEELVILSHPNT